MRARHTLALSLALAGISGVTPGCGTSTSTPDTGHLDGGHLDGGPSSDAPAIFCNGAPIFAGAADETAEVGLTQGDTFTAWHDGDAVAYVWGFQGGTMITPTISAPSSIASPSNPCVLLDIENLEPEGGHVFEAFPRYTTLLDGTPNGDRLELVGVFDQLGNAAIPEHTPLTLDVTIRGTAGAAHTRVRIDVVSSTTLPPECIALPTHGEGCVFRSIPATGRITAIRPVTPADDVPLCPTGGADAMFVEYDLEVDAAYRACTSTPSRTALRLGIQGYLAPPMQCLTDASLEVGSTFPVTYDESIAGTCTPYSVIVPALDPCTASCTGT
ncbi:MAG: hypothetical protein K1X94_15610 [Sandaracinaceae bacterium]|nr:hypothetical protein [Sandaracinaceae bacterium]